MSKRHTKDLTEGPPLQLLLGFMAPLLLGLLFQQFYFMVDTMVVGRLLGAEALAGVGSTGAVNFLILGFCNGCCAGFAIPVAQKFGQRDEQGLKRVVGNIVWLSVLFSTVITLVVSLLCRNILVWMNTPADTMQYAYDYIFIIFVGIPASMLYNVVSGIIRSLGDSKTPLYFLVLSSLLNVALDFALILWADMGVAGAAAATVISQLVSGLLCLLFMAKRFTGLRLSRDDMRPRKDESRLLLGMGIPMGLQYSITAIGSTILQFFVNDLGWTSIAAMTAAGRVYGLLACPMEAIGTAAATYAGQNVGAEKIDRVRVGTKVSFWLGLAYCVLALAAAVFGGRAMLLLFVNPAEPEIEMLIDMSRQYLLVNVCFFPALLGVNLYRYTIQGMGYSNYAVLSGVMELIGRSVLAAVFVPYFGFDAVCFANTAAWLLADLFLVPMYLWAVRTLEKKQSMAKAA